MAEHLSASVAGLTDSGTPDKNVNKYLTPDTINSPFNKMPESGANKYLLMLNKDYFFALSWLIAELGRFKDEGLSTLLIIKALQQTKTVSPAEASKQIRSLIAPDSSNITEILSKVSNISRRFFAEENLDKLLNGIIKTRR